MLRTSLYLIFNLVFLVAATCWSVFSLFDVLACAKEPVWFARSGALIVLFAVWSSYVTKPYVEKEGAVDLLDLYKSSRDSVKAKPLHWLNKLRIAKILLVIELFFSLIGTYIWAYGDIWLVNCAANYS